MSFGPLISTQALADALGAVTVLDASWHMPAAKRDPRREYVAEHIPGALFYDLDALSDPASPLPHMLAPAETFAAAIGALGVGSNDKIVVYDTVGLFSAPRAWWTFRAMGHDNIAVLDGGLPKWKREGRPLEGGQVARAPQAFRARLRPALVRSLAAIKDNLTTRAARVVDARSAGRFAGREAEPRPGLRSGHIPQSANVPWTAVVTAQGTLRAPAEIEAAFRDAGVDLSQPIITTCGSGVSAAILALALETVGKTGTPVYDGSWSEWGGRGDCEIATI